jgi:hypothetical protein
MRTRTMARRITLTVVAAACLAGCSGDGLITGQAGGAGIVVVTKPGTDMSTFQDDYFPADDEAEDTGLIEGTVTEGQVIMAFGENATVSQVGRVSLRLLRDDRVDDFFVSVLDGRGDGVVRP